MAVINRVARESPLQTGIVTSEQRLEGSERMRMWLYEGRECQAERDEYKGAEEGVCLVCSRRPARRHI